MEFINQKLINNVLIIIILLLIANYLSDDSILAILKKYLNLIINYCSNKTETMKNTEFRGRLFPGLKTKCSTTPTIIHDTDFKYIYKNTREHPKITPDINKFYNFLQSIIDKNQNYYEIVSSNPKAIKMTSNDINIINKYLRKSLNCGEFKFKNINILDPIYFFNNPRGKELRPFRIVGDLYINNVPIGKMTLHIEIFIRMDNVFYGPIDSGFPTMTRIKLIQRNNIDTPLANITQNNDYNELNNESDDNLIPDSIHFSTDINNNNDNINYDENNNNNDDNNIDTIVIPDENNIIDEIEAEFDM